GPSTSWQPAPRASVWYSRPTSAPATTTSSKPRSNASRSTSRKADLQARPVVADGQRRVVRPALVPRPGALDPRADRRVGQLRGGHRQAATPTAVVVGRPALHRPPRVRARPLRHQLAVPVHLPAALVALGPPPPLLREEAGVLAVAPPVLQVVLGVRDVEIAHHHGLLARGGGPAPQLRQVQQERPHEPLLLRLLGRARLTAGQIAAAHDDPLDLA